MHLVGYFYETYHDARLSEHKVRLDITFDFAFSLINSSHSVSPYFLSLLSLIRSNFAAFFCFDFELVFHHELLATEKPRGALSDEL